MDNYRTKDGKWEPHIEAILVNFYKEWKQIVQSRQFIYLYQILIGF